MSLLELADWRRRVHELYAEVRRGWAGDAQGVHARWRDVRDELFAAHPETPLADADRSGFESLAYWPYDPELGVLATVDADVEQERFPITTSTGVDMTFVRFGVAQLPFGRLDLFWLDAYGGGVFMPFRDATAGQSTYGGGRYLLDTVKGADLGAAADGRLVLDFNFAYHPSCHYDAAWSCPLAPPGSRLDVAVEAGERLR